MAHFDGPFLGIRYTREVASQHNGRFGTPQNVPPRRMLVVDDHEPFRNFLSATLQAKPEWQIIAEASDGLQAVQKAEQLKPDLILLDIGMPALNGIEAAERISRLVPDAKILFVTQENDPDVVASALSNGAKGLVLKVNAHRELCLLWKQFWKDTALSVRASLRSGQRNLFGAKIRAYSSSTNPLRLSNFGAIHHFHGADTASRDSRPAIFS